MSDTHDGHQHHSGAENGHELGYYAVDRPVHVHDLHATMLHLFGLNHEQLTYRYQGRDFRLTDVSGHVIHDVLA